MWNTQSDIFFHIQSRILKAIRDRMWMQITQISMNVRYHNRAYACVSLVLIACIIFIIQFVGFMCVLWSNYSLLLSLSLQPIEG